MWKRRSWIVIQLGRRGKGWVTAEAEIVISLEAAGFGYQRPRFMRGIGVTGYKELRIYQYYQVLLSAFASRI